MNREQTIKILSTLKAAFPSAYRGMGTADLNAMVTLWERMFANDSYEDVSKAVDTLISTRAAIWTPAIAEVKAEMSKNKKPLQLGSASDFAHSESFRKSIQEWERLWDLGLDPITMKPRNTQPYWRET